MTKQITLEEALKLVSFYPRCRGGWVVSAIHGSVCGDVNGGIGGNVAGYVHGTINGRKWRFIETPKDKLQRLITESGNQELIDAFNQMENN